MPLLLICSHKRIATIFKIIACICSLRNLSISTSKWALQRLVETVLDWWYALHEWTSVTHCLRNTFRKWKFHAVLRLAAIRCVTQLTSSGRQTICLLRVVINHVHDGTCWQHWILLTLLFSTCSCYRQASFVSLVSDSVDAARWQEI
jgi:hypothetical protein